MPYTPLPNRIDPRRSAEKGEIIEAQVPIAGLDRLQTYLSDPEGVVDVSLVFGVDEEGIRTLTGRAETAVRMVCQRCLDAVEIRVRASFNLGIVYKDDAAKALPGHYDPLLMESERLDLSQVVEEELILNLPLIAHHEDCQVKTSYGDRDEGSAADTDKPNPFSVLAALKTDKS